MPRPAGIIRRCSSFDGKRWMCAPHKIQHVRAKALHRKTHVQHSLGQPHAFCYIDRADGAIGPHRGLVRTVFFHLPLERSQLAQVGERFAGVHASVCRGIGVIPPTAPVVIEVCINGISLWAYARVFPKYLPLAGLIVKRQNFAPTSGSTDTANHSFSSLRTLRSFIF